MFKPHGTGYEAPLGIDRPIVEPLLIRGERDRGGDALEGLLGRGGRERDAGWGDECEEIVGDCYELGSRTSPGSVDDNLPRWKDG